MKRSEIQLIGNLYWDRVYALPEWPRRNATNLAASTYVNVGGIANVARQIHAIDPEIPVDLCSAVGDDGTGRLMLDQLALEGIPTGHVAIVAGAETTCATILVDAERSERTSIVALGACSETRLLPAAAAWHHIAYLDSLHGIRTADLHSAPGTVSADLCRAEHSDAERARLVDLFGAVDYLLLSDTECQGLCGRADAEAARQLGSAVRGWAIVHHAAGSWSSDGERSFTQEIEIDPGIDDVLGAGDAFAATFIHRVHLEINIEVAVAAAHEAATDCLRIKT